MRYKHTSKIADISGKKLPSAIDIRLSTERTTITKLTETPAEKPSSYFNLQEQALTT